MAAISLWTQLRQLVRCARFIHIRQFIFLGHSHFKKFNIYQLFAAQVVKSKLKQIRNESWEIKQFSFSMTRIKILAGHETSLSAESRGSASFIYFPCSIYLCCQDAIFHVIFSRSPCVYFKDFFWIGWAHSPTATAAQNGR